MKNYFLISLFFMVLATVPIHGMESSPSTSEPQWHYIDALSGETISIASKYILPNTNDKIRPSRTPEELMQIKSCIESYEEGTVFNYDFKEICSLLPLLHGVVIDDIIDVFMSTIYRVINSEDIRQDAVNIVESIIKNRTVSDEFKESFINHFYSFILKILSEHDKDSLFESIIERAHEELQDKSGFYVNRLYFVIYSSVIIARFYLPDNGFRNEILMDIKNSVALDGTVYKELCNDLIDIGTEKITKQNERPNLDNHSKLNTMYSIRPTIAKTINFFKSHPRLHFLATAGVGSITTLAWCAPYFYKNDSFNKIKIAEILGAGLVTTGLSYYLKEKLLPKKLLGTTWSSVKEQQALVSGSALALGLCAGIKYLSALNT